MQIVVKDSAAIPQRSVGSSFITTGNAEIFIYPATNSYLSGRARKAKLIDMVTFNAGAITPEVQMMTGYTAFAESQTVNPSTKLLTPAVEDSADFQPYVSLGARGAGQWDGGSFTPVLFQGAIKIVYTATGDTEVILHIEEVASGVL